MLRYSLIALFVAPLCSHVWAQTPEQEQAKEDAETWQQLCVCANGERDQSDDECATAKSDAVESPDPDPMSLGEEDSLKWYWGRGVHHDEAGDNMSITANGFRDAGNVDFNQAEVLWAFGLYEQAAEEYVDAEVNYRAAVPAYEYAFDAYNDEAIPCFDETKERKELAVEADQCIYCEAEEHLCLGCWEMI